MESRNGNQSQNSGVTKLFVGNITRGSDATELRYEFSKYGNVLECDIITDYGFVHFSDPAEADAAIGLNGLMFNGQKLKVEKSTSSVRKKAGSGSMGPDACYVCNKSGHWAKNCPELSEQEREQRRKSNRGRGGGHDGGSRGRRDDYYDEDDYDYDYPPRRRRPPPPGYYDDYDDYDPYYRRRPPPPRYPYDYDYDYPPRRRPPPSYYWDEYDDYDYPPPRRPLRPFREPLDPYDRDPYPHRDPFSVYGRDPRAMIPREPRDPLSRDLGSKGTAATDLIDPFATRDAREGVDRGAAVSNAASGDAVAKDSRDPFGRAAAARDPVDIYHQTSATRDPRDLYARDARDLPVRDVSYPLPPRDPYPSRDMGYPPRQPYDTRYVAGHPRETPATPKPAPNQMIDFTDDSFGIAPATSSASSTAKAHPDVDPLAGSGDGHSLEYPRRYTDEAVPIRQF